MERLSDAEIEIVNDLHKERLDYNSEYIPLIDAVNRLASYEDSGCLFHGCIYSELLSAKGRCKMTDILIRMEMPKTCADCHDADLPTAIAFLGAKCPWANGIIDPGVYDLRRNRHPNCPLVELPKHGDLVDADELRAVAYERGKEHQCVAFVDPLDITLAPVIVSSNKENTE